MITPWIEEVRQRWQLRVHAHESMQCRAWRGLFDQALSEFNALSGAHGLGIALVSSEQPPATQGLGGADVMISAASGVISTPYDGLQQPTSFDGHSLHGLIRKVFSPGGQRMVKSFIYVPAEPFVPEPRRRLVGPGVRLVILVHELVHACGLSNVEHSGSGDLFQGFVNILQPGTPEQDRVDLGRYGSNNLALGMPPLVLGEATVRYIQNAWASSSSPRPTRERSGSLGPGPVGLAPRFAALDLSSNPSTPSIGQTRFPQPGPLV